MLQVIGHLPAEGHETSIKWTKLDTESTLIPQISWKVLPIQPPADKVNKQYGEWCMYMLRALYLTARSCSPG